jgi:hypothetical protein
VPRPHVEHVHAADIAPQPLGWPGWPRGATCKLLSRDDESGACSCLLALPDGWRREPSIAAADCELLVVSGMLRVGSDALERGSYSFVPAGEPDEAWLAVGATEVFLAARTGPPGVRPCDGRGAGASGVIRLSAERLPWGPTPIPNGPPNIELAMLRHTHTGEMSALVRGGPRRFPVYEFHDCVEECFLLDGEIMIEPGGQMRARTYFWRPPYRTHGQSRCETSSLLYVYTDSKLINHLRTTCTERRPRTARRRRQSAPAARRGTPPRHRLRRRARASE